MKRICIILVISLHVSLIHTTCKCYCDRPRMGAFYMNHKEHRSLTYFNQTHECFIALIGVQAVRGCVICLLNSAGPSEAS